MNRPQLPSGYYVYAIRVSRITRYIGKGTGLRLYCHMREVRSRLNREFKLENIESRLQRNLTAAVLSGEKVVEQILIDGLSEKSAYKLEHAKLREYVLAGKREQLWNVIPGNIFTSEELRAFTERLQQNTKSRDKWIRYLSGKTLAVLTEYEHGQSARELSRSATEGIKRFRGSS